MYNRCWGDYLKQYAYDLLRQEVQTYQGLKEFKHDFINHINIIKLYIQMDMVDKSVDYIDKLLDFVDDHSVCQKITGNLEIDMLVSSKIKKIYEIGCDIDIESNISEKLKIDIFDVVSVLGNLLDNCYEALINANEKRLSLDIDVVNDNLYIAILNTHNNTMVEENNNILTTKQFDAENHGIGIKSVRNCIKKYDGKMMIEYDDKEFYTEIYIPLKSQINYSWNEKA